MNRSSSLGGDRPFKFLSFFKSKMKM